MTDEERPSGFYYVEYDIELGDLLGEDYLTDSIAYWAARDQVWYSCGTEISAPTSVMHFKKEPVPVPTFKSQE